MVPCCLGLFKLWIMFHLICVPVNSFSFHCALWRTFSHLFYEFLRFFVCFVKMKRASEANKWNRQKNNKVLKCFIIVHQHRYPASIPTIHNAILNGHTMIIKSRIETARIATMILNLFCYNVTMTVCDAFAAGIIILLLRSHLTLTEYTW